jgi:adenylate cyclase
VLNVSAVVTGSVRRVGDRVHVDVGLIDAKSNKQLWARRYDHAVTDVVDIQRDATRAIVAALRIDVTDAERAVLDRPVTTNAQAYDFSCEGGKSS